MIFIHLLNSEQTATAKPTWKGLNFFQEAYSFSLLWGLFVILEFGSNATLGCFFNCGKFVKNKLLRGFGRCPWDFFLRLLFIAGSFDYPISSPLNIETLEKFILANATSNHRVFHLSVFFYFRSYSVINSD